MDKLKFIDDVHEDIKFNHHFIFGIITFFEARDDCSIFLL